MRPQDLEIVLTILRNYLPQDAKVWVFGSRAKGKAHRGSDLDLAIDANRPLTSKEKSQLENAFYESNLPYKVDIVDMQNVSDSFRPYIEKEQIVLDWEKKTYFDPNILANATLFISMYELLKGFIESRINGFFLDDILKKPNGNKVYSNERPGNGKKGSEKEKEQLKFIEESNLLNPDHIRLLIEAKHLRNKCAHELPELLVSDFYEKYASSVGLPSKLNKPLAISEFNEKIKKSSLDLIDIGDKFFRNWLIAFEDIPEKDALSPSTNSSVVTLMEMLREDMKNL